ncbi:hypothetical protein RJ639_013867 [Escallonia herrerae]|uniref:Pinin/SDK/MemA protein domain-containing protein n=1 Tax=Escallonia herrerae TaxID=1293975 RepID=A0AA88VJU2_9ASTE|nr:hypothetical protein RJ639_013867 [Escallonia herrerae]
MESAVVVVEKTEEVLRKELEELNRQQWEVEDGEIIEDATTEVANNVNKDAVVDESVEVVDIAKQDDGAPSNWNKRDGNQRPSKIDFKIPPAVHVPRVLPKDEDPSLVKRNKRMLGQLLGTLQKFREEDVELSSSKAFMLRSASLKKAEQRAHEESERLRQQEREKIAEKRRRDLTLRARVAAKAEEKKLELLFLRWSEHHRKLGNFIRTKAEPRIYYSFAKPMEEDAALVEQRKDKIFQEWKAARREELSQYEKQLGEQYVANVEKEQERWQNARKGRKVNNDAVNLQETMDQELETHRLEHGPKTRKIPGGSNNEDEDDVEDINVEDDMLEDVLDVDDSRKAEETLKLEAGSSNSNPDNKDQ